MPNRDLIQFSSAAWHLAVRLSVIVEPDLSFTERLYIVKMAHGSAVEHTAVRRIKINPSEVAASQVGWQLGDDAFLWGYTLLHLAYARLNREEPDRPMTVAHFLAALIATGMVTAGNRSATPVAMAVCMLDVLQGVPRHLVVDFLSLALPRTDKQFQEGAYNKAVLKTLRLFCQRTGLELEQGLGQRPTRVPALLPLNTIEARRFWESTWPPFSLGSAAKHAKAADRWSVIEQSGKGGSHEQLFHLLLCESCHAELAQRFLWKREVYLPHGKSDHSNPLRPISDEEVQTIREVCETEARARHTASGRLLVAVDGGRQREWSHSDVLKPKRTIEFFRGSISVLWHEVTPQGDEETLVTEYKVGSSSYTITESPHGVSVRVTPLNKAARIPLLAWWFWAPALLSIGLLWSVLLRPVAEPGRLRADVLEGTLGGTIQQGLLPLAQDTAPSLGSSFRLLVSPASGSPFTCPESRSLMRREDSGWIWVFDCGQSWQRLGPEEVSLTMIETRWGVIERQSRTVRRERQFN